MKKVVMYTVFRYGIENQTGGTKRYLELINGFLHNGYAVHLFIPEEAVLADHKNLFRHNIRKISVKSKFIPNGLLNLILNFFILNSIRKLSYDEIVVFDIPYTIQLVLLKLKNINLFIRQDFINYRIVSLSLQDNLVDKFYLKILKQIERNTLIKVKNIYVQSTNEKDIILDRHKKQYKKIVRKIHIVNNNVNPSWLNRKYFERQNDNYAELKKIFFIGDISDKRKGFFLLLNAFNELSGKNKNLSLNVIGDGVDFKNKKKLFEKNKNCYFYGRLRDPVRVLSKADLLVVPSLADSFPNTIMEALFLEIPVIGARVGGIPEILKYEDLIFEPDVNSIINKIQEIITKNKLLLLRELSKKRKIEFSFDWVKKVCEIIENKNI